MDPRRREVKSAAGCSRQGRLGEPPFFILRLGEPPFFIARRAVVRTAASLAFAVGAGFALPAIAQGAADAWLVLGEPGMNTLRTLDCASGRAVAETTLPAPLSAPPALASAGDAVYAATAPARLLRLALPELLEQARAPLRFDAAVLAASGGRDAIVLAGGSGSTMLSAHDPNSLATLHEYALGEPATVSTIVDVPSRARFTVAFSDLPEAWEIAYDRDAPAVLQGLVHDYRMREAVELPGRLTPRRFRVPDATRAIVAGAFPYELLRIDAAGRAGIVHLEVRREIERAAVEALPPPSRIAAWRSGSQRGWVFADEGASALRVFEAGRWKLAAPLPSPGELLAVAPDDGRVLVAHRHGDDVVVSTLDVSSQDWKTLVRLPQRAAMTPTALRFVAATAGCVAVVDRDGTWHAGVTREIRAAARNRGS